MEAKRRIKIWQDSNASCPFEDWDCEPDLMYYGGRNNGKTDYSKGNILSFIQEKTTTSTIIRHQKTLAEILEIDLEYFKDNCFTKDEKADDIRSEMSNASIEQLAKLCELFKIPHTQYVSRGNSQGDWADVLIVLTDEFFERTGCQRKNSEEILEGTATLFDQWAWGDVYGFTIVEIRTCDLGCEHEETLDSCGGFFGDDWMTNGMTDLIEDELHEQLKNYDYNDIEY